MPDVGHELTDKAIKDLEKKVAREYNQARKEVQSKLNRYMADFATEDEKKRQLMQEGKITQKDYQDWRLRKMGMGKRWEEMRDNLAQDYHNANQIARSIERGYMPDVYALNHNYATYQIEHDGGIDSFYSLYDKPTVERLIREDQILMPEPGPRRRAQIAANKDMQWNNQMLQSALTQSILQGESIPEMARRISQTVAVRNYNSSVRYARTMMTSAQNAGRYDAYRRATDMGIDLTIEWCATLDDRTRHDHRMMHGQRRSVDEPFETPDGFRIYYPADCTGESDAPQQEIWNCRCTLLAWVKGFERDTVKESPGRGDMTFEEWQNEKIDSEKHNFGIPKSWEKLESPSNDKVLKGTNPNFDRKMPDYLRGTKQDYKYNCTNCVVAYDARKKGWNVTAASYGDNKKLAAGDNVFTAWVGREPTKASGSGYEDIISEMENYKNGSYMVVSITKPKSIFKDEDGHVFIAEKRDGKVLFVDPQSASIYTKNVFKTVEEGGTLYMRVDDLEISDRGVSACKRAK